MWVTKVYVNDGSEKGMSIGLKIRLCLHVYG